MTKWRIKRLEGIEDKINFSWEALPNQHGYKWDWEKIEAEIEKMEINEEKIIEIL